MNKSTKAVVKKLDKAEAVAKAVEEKEVAVPKERVVTAKRAVNAPVVSNGDVVYSSAGGVAYNPRVTHNAEAWDKVQAVLGTNQRATHTELCAVLVEHFKYSAENHYNFINYMVRRKSLNIVK